MKKLSDYTKADLQRVAAGMVQKPKPIYKPSANIVRLKALVAKMLAKKPIPKATAVAPIVKAPGPIEKKAAIVSSRLKFIKNWVATMAVGREDLKAITQNELQALTDAELDLLKRQIDAAQRQRTYDRTRGAQ